MAVAAPVAAGPCPPPPPGPGSIPLLRYADLTACPDDCSADRDDNGSVDVFDLLGYLDDWFAGLPSADLDGNATVDVFDLLQFLDLWFEGCE